MAVAWDRLLEAVSTAGLADCIALVELHNEFDSSMLPPIAEAKTAVAWLSARHPEVPVTISYAMPPHLEMWQVPDGLGALQMHIYCYGVLAALERELELRDEGAAFPGPALLRMLREGAPSWEGAERAAGWKYRATVVGRRQFYAYDWVDPSKWDRWLEANVDRYRLLMEREIESRVIAAAGWSRHRGQPLFIGEGWVGYTPLESGFEEGPVGLALAEHGIRTALAHGVAGLVLGSNFAPHHPAWALVEWQQKINELIQSTDR